VGPSICLATWADEKYCNWVVAHQKARARHLGFVRSRLKPICFFGGSHPHCCLTKLLALQRRQKNKLSLLAAGSFYNTHHKWQTFTYLPSMALTDLRASHVGQTHNNNKHVLPIMRPPCMVHPFTSFLWPIQLDFLTCGRICEHTQVVRSYPQRFVVVVKFICLHFLLPHCVGFHYHRAPSFNVTGWFWSGQCSVGHVCIWL